jgi:hypothetical protein
MIPGSRAVSSISHKNFQNFYAGFFSLSTADRKELESRLQAAAVPAKAGTPTDVNLLSQSCKFSESLNSGE